MIGRIKSFFGKIWRKFRKPKDPSIVKKIKKIVKDPPLDFVAAGVFGSLLGRTVLYFWVGAAMLGMGLYIQAGLMVVLISFDCLIHGMSIGSLVRLIRMEAEQITTPVAEFIDKGFAGTPILVD